ncbi:MAG: hypothetical protein HRF49_03855 [bacterium]|jgi:hypothetical protein
MWRICAFIFIAAVLCGTRDARAQEEPKNAEGDMRRIESVSLSVSFSEGDIRPEIADDLRDAIREVTELALIVQLEGDLAVVESDIAAITETLTRVINITLDKRGFRVESLVITPGEATAVDIVLAVSGEQVVDVLVEIKTPSGGELPEMMLEESEAALVSALRRRFQGMPIADRSWVTSLFDNAIRGEFERIPDLLHFRQRSEIVLAPEARVTVYIEPAAGVPVLRRHVLRTRSSTLLNISMDALREIALVAAAELDGMPVELVEKYRHEAERLIAEKVAASRTLAIYAADVEVSLEIRSNELWVSMIVESPRYRTSVEGRVDFNRDENNPRIEGRLGIKGPSYTEAYVNLRFFPGGVNAEPEAGLGFNPLPGMFLGAGWDFDREVVKIRGGLWLGTNLQFSVENYPGGEYDADSEYRATYRMTDDFSISAIADGEGKVWMGLGVTL